MPFVIKVHQYRWQVLKGENYVEDCDVEAHDGRGSLLVTKRKEKARKFESVKEALEFWNKQSVTRPFREDGKPNKPLTAFTASIEPLWEKEGD